MPSAEVSSRHAIHPEHALSELMLVFDLPKSLPSLEAAQEVLESIQAGDATEVSGGWAVTTSAGQWQLAITAFDEDWSKEMIPKDRVRFRPQEVERIAGERLALLLSSDLSEQGLPGFHQQIQTLVATAESLGLSNPIGMRDRSGNRWHPPGWIHRMVESEAGPSPTMTFHAHAVYDEDEQGENRYWIHSHGVARFTGFDVGCVDVRPEHYERVSSVVELAAAFAVDNLEWPAGEPMSVLYGLDLARLPWQEGVKALAPSVIGTADDYDEEHTHLSLLVVPDGEGWQGPGKEVSALESLVALRTTRESERGAQAARETYGVLRDWQRNTDVAHRVLVKSPITTESGDIEHCWFEVDRLSRSSLRATLISQPWGETDVQPGDTLRLKVAGLSEWLVQLETGSFGPDELEALLVATEVEKDR